MIRYGLLLATATFLVGCDSTANNYYARGPGSDLNVTRATNSSNTLSAYVDIMCRDAGIAVSDGNNGVKCPQAIEENKTGVLLQAGFNEIRTGCRAFVQFLFEERLRERRFKNGNLAVQTFVNGILTLEGSSARLFSYLILTSTTANSFYDAGRLDPLQGMTVPNILKIVEKRQNAFEDATNGVTINSVPQLVGLWREYQWLCTPLSINTDFNALAAASVDGSEIDFKSEAEARVSNAIIAVRSFDANRGLRNQGVPVPSTGSLGLIETKLFKTEVQQIQRSLCIGTDGTFGPNTRATVDAWRQIVSNNSLTKEDLEKGLDANQVRYLKNTSSCSALGYKSAFERGFIYDELALNGTASALLPAKRAERLSLLANELGVTVPAGTTAPTPDMRTIIETRRDSFGLSKGDFIDAAFFSKLVE